MQTILPTVAGAGPELVSPLPNSFRGAKAAREFEAQLIAQLLQSLEKTFASTPGENTTAGADDYSYLGAQALGTALAAGGGFGIAAMICKELAAHESKEDRLTLGSVPTRPIS